MLPPPGIEPLLSSSLIENASTTLLSAAVATAASLIKIGVDLPAATSTLAAVIATASAQASSHDKPKEQNGECQLLGPFAILVQGSLGILALLSLVYKRWRERPQRPLKIWSFDVSKQVVGSVLVHIANLMMSLLSSGQLSVSVDAASISRRAFGMEGLSELVRRGVHVQGKYKPNPCSFYLLNLAIDTTVGIPILIILLRLLTALFTLTPFGNPPESIISGNYGSPPRAFWWFKQSIIYFIGLMGMKLCVLVIFLVAPWISRIGDWALRWTEGDEVLQVIFVMLVFPVIMNATQYYIIDSFIQNQKPGDHEQIASDDPDNAFNAARDAEPYTEPDSAEDDLFSDEEADPEVLAKTKESKKTIKDNVKDRPHSSGSRGSKATSQLKTAHKDYDPLLDGESSPTTVVGSAKSGDSSKRDEDDDTLLRK